MTTGRRSALLVATDRYEDEGLTQLRAPAGDAEALADVLRDPSIGGFEVPPPLLNQPESVVRREIEDLLDSARLNDTVLLYISGHGVLSQSGQLFFAMADTLLRRLRSTGVPDTFVHDAMKDSRARRKVLILDCCHSGAFARGMATKSDGHVHVVDRFQGRGQVTLTASDELEYALEEDQVTSLGVAQANSLFTRALVEGLRSGEADGNHDGHVTVDELYEYVLDHMRDRTTSQTPGIQGAKQGEIIIASARPGAGAALPPGLLAQLESPFVGVRAGVLEELAGLLGSADAAVAGAATQALERMLGDDSLKIRHAAGEALGRPREAVPETDPATPAGVQRARLKPQVANLLRRAEAKQARGELEPARGDLEEALRLSPDSVEALAARGELRRRLADFAGAREDFAAALALEPDDYASLVGRGRVDALEGETELGLAALARAVELDPGCPDAYLARGFVLAFALPRRREEAAADFEHVLASEPEHPEALAGVGLLATPDRPKEAAGAFERALAAEAEQPLALAFRGALRAAGAKDAIDQSNALDDLERAATLDPRSPYIRAVRGSTLAGLWRPAEAIAELDALLAMLPRNAAALAERGAMRVQLGKPDEALADLEAALAIDPRSATALLWRGTVKLRRSQPEAALEDLDVVIGRDEEAFGPPVAQLRAETLLALGRAEEALGDLEGAPASTLDAPLLAVRGKARLELGRPVEALGDAKQALELHATHDAARDLLVRSFLAVAATIAAPAGLKANKTLVGDAELESGWYDDQKKAVLDVLTGTEQPLWLCRCRRQGEMFRSVAFLVTTEQVVWCKQGAFGSAQPDRIIIAHIKKVERIDGGFKIRGPGNFEAAFTGFTGGGIDLVGPGVSLAGDDLLALLRLLVERGRAAA